MEHVDLSLYSLEPERGESGPNTYTQTGFPSPALDYTEKRIRLSDELMPNPASTFLARIRGHHLRHLGLQDGDLLVIDRSIPLSAGKMVLAHCHGSFLIRFLQQKNGRLVFTAGPESRKSDPSPADQDCRFWGVIQHVIHSV